MLVAGREQDQNLLPVAWLSTCIHNMTIYFPRPQSVVDPALLADLDDCLSSGDFSGQLLDPALPKSPEELVLYCRRDGRQVVGRRRAIGIMIESCVIGHGKGFRAVCWACRKCGVRGIGRGRLWWCCPESVGMHVARRRGVHVVTNRQYEREYGEGVPGCVAMYPWCKMGANRSDRGTHQPRPACRQKST